MILHGEEWKELPLDFDFVNECRVEVSSLGRVKIYNSRSPEGRITAGTLQGGYPIVRLKLYKKRTEEVLKKIDEFNSEIERISEKLKNLKKTVDSKLEHFVQQERLRAKRFMLVDKRSKFIKRTDKKRTINFHFLVHRAVAELFLEKGENEELVIHKDFIKTNNKVSNLQWVSKEEAFARYAELPMYKNKDLLRERYTSDKKRGRSKLSSTDILYIKEKLAQGKTLRSLAQKYNVSDMQIHRIKTGENWSEVKTVSELIAANRK